MRSKILSLAILFTIIALPFAAWLPAHLFAAANFGSQQTEVTVYANPAFGNGGGGGGGGEGGGGGGGGLGGITPILNVTTNEGRFLDDVIAKSADKKLEIYIPKDTIGKNRAGSLISSIRISIDDDRPPPPSATKVIGEVYDIKPDGAIFDPPITLTFKYDVSELPEGVAETVLAVYKWNLAEEQWIQLESTVDTENHTVSAKIGGFSIYAAMVRTLPASFSIAELAITPDEVQLGESVNVNVTITNDGDLTGSYEVNLQIDELLVQTKEVTLAGGDSETVSFIITLDTIGEHVVNVGSLSGACEVRAPKLPATFVTSALTVFPYEVGVGESVNIKARVTNTGELPGDYELILKVDGQVTDTKEITLAGQESRQVMFTLSRNIAGSYVLSIDDLSSMLRVYPQLAPPEKVRTIPPATPVNPPVEPVEPAEQPATPISISLWVITAIIAAGFIGGIGLMFAIRLRRYR